MSPAVKTRLMKYTPEQDTAIDALLAATGETYADMVRRLIEGEAAKHHITFPQNMPTKQQTMAKAREMRRQK